MKKDKEWRRMRIEEGWGIKKMRNKEGYGMKKDKEWRRMRIEEGWGIKKMRNKKDQE